MNDRTSHNHPRDLLTKPCFTLKRLRAENFKRLCNFQLEIFSKISKVETENWLEHWTAVSFCLELDSSAHQRSLVGTEPTTSQLKNKSLTAGPRVPVLDLNRRRRAGFQTEGNNCPVLQSVFGIQIYCLLMNF